MAKCKKKALTPAEKQHRYREKRRQDTERDTAYKEKQKLRNAKRKKVDEMSNRQHRIAKKNWKASSAAYRKRKAQKAASTPIPEISPSESRQKKQGRKSVLKNR